MVRIDEMVLTNDDKRGVDPPRVAHIGQLFGPAIEASLESLPLLEPVGERVRVDQGECVEDGERGHRAPHVGSVGLHHGQSSEAAVVVLALGHELPRPSNVDAVQRVAEFEQRHCTVAEAHVHLQFGQVSVKPSRLSVHQAHHVLFHSLSTFGHKLAHSVQQYHYQHSVVSRCDMRVMSCVPS